MGTQKWSRLPTKCELFPKSRNAHRVCQLPGEKWPFYCLSANCIGIKTQDVQDICSDIFFYYLWKCFLIAAKQIRFPVWWLFTDFQQSLKQIVVTGKSWRYCKNLWGLRGVCTTGSGYGRIGKMSNILTKSVSPHGGNEILLRKLKGKFMKFCVTSGVLVTYYSYHRSQCPQRNLLPMQ